MEIKGRRSSAPPFRHKIKGLKNAPIMVRGKVSLRASPRFAAPLSILHPERASEMVRSGTIPFKYLCFFQGALLARHL